MLLLFAHPGYYPRGGADDFIGIVTWAGHEQGHPYLEVAEVMLANLVEKPGRQAFESAHVLDTDTLTIVARWERTMNYQELDSKPSPWRRRDVPAEGEPR